MLTHTDSSSWQAQLLASCCAEVSVPYHVDLIVGQFTACRMALLRASQGVYARQKARFFCNLFLAVTPHHFCHILFLRIQSIDPVHTQGQGTTGGCRYQERQGFGGDISEAAYLYRHARNQLEMWDDRTSEENLNFNKIPR